MIILPQQVTEAINILENSGYDAYVVGECVREMVLGNSPQDFDIVTNAGINDILFAFRDYRISDDGMARGEIMVTILGMVIAVSPYRREVVGSRVIYAPDLETDLARRGFTMNAMAYSTKEGLIDPYDGKGALLGDEVKKIVAIGENVTVNVKVGGLPVAQTIYDMTKSFSICPSRLLEAIRYCSEDEYEIEEQTKNCMRANVACFDYADADVLREELQRIVMGKYAARALEQNGDILKYIIPEIEPCIGCNQCSPHHDFDVWTHICKAVGFSLPEPSIRFAMLFHDLGKPDCMSLDKNGRGHFKGHGERSRLLAECIMRRLNFPKNLSEEISWLVYHHDVKIPEERKELKALIRELGPQDLKDLLQCEIADSRARKADSEPPQTVALRKSLSDLNEIITTNECYDISQLAVSRRELLERGLARNEQEAEQLMNALFDIVLDKPSFNNRLMLIDIAEKSKSKLEQIEAAKRRAEEEKAELEKARRAKGRRGEPIFSKKKKQ
ncbi:MAG: HD domain-containing protein [Oscillospiraceae bacterium]|nr:HD domain-containing protein [Oscillospiraceae bacterium]